MKKLLERAAAAAVSAVLASACLGTIAPCSAADETDTPAAITVTFDYSDEGITTEDSEALAPMTVDVGDTFLFPEASLEKDGLIFRGWTLDGVRGFIAGDVYTVKESDDLTFTPVWSVDGDKNRHNIIYYVEVDGEEQDASDINGVKAVQGQMIQISLQAFYRNDARQNGWTDGTTEFLGQQRYIMPDHDVTFTPVWRFYRTLRYYAGDDDRIVGKNEVVYERLEAMPLDLADASTFKCSGFKLVGWKCDADGETYPVYGRYTMPKSDVTFTAVWEPIEVTVLFKMVTEKGTTTISTSGITDTTMILPEPTAQKAGFVFAGWQYGDDIYQPGDEFLIYRGSTLTALYIEDTAARDWGDANGDKNADMSDVVAIMRWYANKEDFPIPDDRLALCDVYGNGDGVTNSDALAIQKFEAGIYTSLPVTE